MKIAHPHDKVFKAAMKELKVARSVLEQHLPKALTDNFVWSTFQLCNETFINQNLDKDELDMLYHIKLKDARDAYIYLLVEGQSTVDPLMPWRIINYTCQIIDHHLLTTKSKVLPVVVPLVIYTGAKPYNKSLSVFDLFGDQKDLAKSCMFDKFQLVDLSQVPDEAIVQSQYASLLQIVMKHVHDRDFIAQAQAYFAKALRNLADNSPHITIMVKYLMQEANIQDQEAFFNLIEASLPQPAKGEIMTLAEQLRSEGYNAGLQQNMRQERKKGEYNLFMRLLKKKFSIVPETYLHRIDEADEDKLLTWGERLIVASKLQDIFEGEDE